MGKYQIVIRVYVKLETVLQEKLTVVLPTALSVNEPNELWTRLYSTVHNNPGYTIMCKFHKICCTYNEIRCTVHRSTEKSFDYEMHDTRRQTGATVLISITLTQHMNTLCNFL